MSGPRYFAVVPAAGAGRRFEAAHPKQYALLAGRAVIDHTLDTLLQDPHIDTVVVALAQADTHWESTDASRNPAIRTVTGGRERSASVMNGLAALTDTAAPADWVLVHDAARPCLRAADLGRLIESLHEHPHGGLLAIPVPDTLKRSSADGHTVARTLDRQSLWLAQTPQLFRYALLLQALQRHTTNTDEAQAMEHAGYHPQLIRGNPGNLKITTREDLHLAEAVLQGAGRCV